MQRLKDKVAIVTGAAGGIGLACAERFAADGAKIVISDINAEAGKAAAAKLTQAGHDAIFVQTDVTQRQAIDDLIAEGVKAFGQIDIMLNNAGIALSAPFLETSDELFDK